MTKQAWLLRAALLRTLGCHEFAQAQQTLYNWTRVLGRVSLRFQATLEGIMFVVVPAAVFRNGLGQGLWPSLVLRGPGLEKISIPNPLGWVTGA